MAEKGNNAYKYRAPRVPLDETTDRIMRFYDAKHPTTPLYTESLDLSSSGLTFLVDSEKAPRLDQILIVEFKIPGNEQIRWFCRVARLEYAAANSPWTSSMQKMKVAVEFRQLPQALKRKIHVAVMTEIQRHFTQEMAAAPSKLKLYLEWAPHVMLWFVSFVTVLFLFFLLTRPSFNYDWQHPVIWGKRF